MKKFIYIGLAVVAVVGAIFLSRGGQQEATAEPTKHTFGDGKSGIVLVEYADFQCPGCGGFYPILKEIKAKYKDQITFQFVNFPLSQIHPNALPAHRAAHAASLQGKFWEMHDLLFENQQIWSNSTNIVRDLEAYATQIGLDLVKYRTDYAAASTNRAIQADIRTGQEKRVSGTPTFFLDGKRIEDNNSIASLDKFSKVIEEAIAAKTGQQTPDTSAQQPATRPEGQ